MLNKKTFLHKEEFEESVKFRNMSVIQISPGLFSSTMSSIHTKSVVLDRRVTHALHVQQFSMPLGEICLVFPNVRQDIHINGRLINDSSQIALFSEETITALLPKKSDLSVTSIRGEILAAYLSEERINAMNRCGEKIRKQPHNTALKQRVHALTKRSLYLAECGFCPESQLQKDILDNIYFSIARYFESFDLPAQKERKDKLSHRVLNNLKHILVNQDVISLSDLTQGLHCTPRTINNVVRKHFSCTPQQLVAIVRLNKIRKALIEPSVFKKTIKHLSERFGVSNPSKMAKDYEWLFGEKMKDTIYAND